ncbi:hypothetical protein HGRIS_000118 [Hohenbuehelia grisea]|uniref:NadR/Ttd14 AAA domain-containing protein n=1 Tax=Hohenbuehelia grisea TaxID=104357 RepID=A0ABR3JR15_9AGAR
MYAEKSASQITIYIVGPSSTGKSTLCGALAKRLGISGKAYVTEVARSVMTAQGYTRNDIGKIEMQRAIMDAQIVKEEEGSGSPIQLCDRSAIDPIVYSILTAQDSSEAENRRMSLVTNPSFQRTLGRYRHSIFILLSPNPLWLKDDGIRSLEKQEECYLAFKEVLRDFGLGFREIGRDMPMLAERVSLVMGLARL